MGFPLRDVSGCRHLALGWLKKQEYCFLGCKSQERGVESGKATLHIRDMLAVGPLPSLRTGEATGKAASAARKVLWFCSVFKM